MIQNDNTFNEGEWEIIEKNCRKGGFSKISKAKNINGIINGTIVNQKMVAIKKIKFDGEIKLNEVNNLELIKNKNKEMQISSIIDYYGYGIKGNKLYIYLEFIEGQTFYELKKNKYPLNEKQISIILKKCLETLKFLHKNCNLIHMDLKCDNIILKPNNNNKNNNNNNNNNNI
ncbi:hypothetical protein ACTFIR_005354 [Dictyostelium discoideum]